MTGSVAVISDIHGNLQALQAVLADIEEQGINERICLGDIVGYGANPAEARKAATSPRPSDEAIDQGFVMPKT